MKVTPYCNRLSASAILAMMGLFLSSTFVAAQVDDEGSFAVILGDAFAAGRSVVLDRTDMHDVFAAGEDVTLAATADGNAHLAGRHVEVSAPLTGSLYAGGQTVDIDADISGRLYAGGEVVKIRDGVTVERGARIGARRITLDGVVRQSAAFGAQRVEVNGTIDGDAEFAGEEIVIAPGARITGALTYHAPERIEVPVGVVESGQITYVPLEEEGREFGMGMGRPFGWVFRGLWRLALGILGGALFLAILPRLSGELATVMETKPWPAVGWGAVGLIALFAVMGLMVVSILGIPLAAVMALATPLILFVAYVHGAFGLGVVGAARLGRSRSDTWVSRMGILAASLFALTLVGFIPLLGFLVGFGTMLLGLGAAVLLWRGQSPTAQPA